MTVDLPPASSVFVVFRAEEREDHLVAVNEAPAEQGGRAIEVASLQGDSVPVRVSRPGTYRVESARGRRGEIAVAEVPADQPVEGPWRVTFPKNLGAPDEIVMETLADWTGHTDPGVRYFSGTARYHTRFMLPEALAAAGSPVILDLGVAKEVAEVTVNGRKAGVLWQAPAQLDLSGFVQAGENQLEISVTNLWNNRLVGALQDPSQAAITRTNLKDRFTAASPLLPSGLLGPVTLRFPVAATIPLESPSGTDVAAPPAPDRPKD